MIYNLSLTGEQVQQVLNALYAFPYREVFMTVRNIESQVQNTNEVMEEVGRKNLKTLSDTARENQELRVAEPVKE